MSRVSRLMTIFIGIALLATEVSAHGRLSLPTSREYQLDISTQDFPVISPLTTEFVCKYMPALPNSMMTTLTAGQSTSILWDFDAVHPGDCFAFISYDVNADDSAKRWFKVYQFENCNNVNHLTQNFTVPSYLPPCDHCILRWEWHALHLQPTGIVEFYAQCADIVIKGDANNVALPTPLVTIPGHIPMDASKYRDTYDPNDNTPPVGPPVATIGGAAYDCTSVYGPSCTTMPTPKGPCTISAQECVSQTSYHACGQGIGQTIWYAAQGCGAGTVCVNISTVLGPRVNCLRPTDPLAIAAYSNQPVAVPSTTASPIVVPSTTASPIVVPSTTASPIVVPSTTAAAKPVTTGTPIVVPSTTAAAKPMTTATPRPSTTASPIVVPSTTAAAVPSTSAASVPSTSASATPSTSASSATCTQGNMKCLSSETYSTCNRGVWGASQSCRQGFTCSPSGNYIYCI